MLNTPNTGLFQCPGDWSLSRNDENRPLCVEHGDGGPLRIHIPRVPGHRQNLPSYAPHNTVYAVFSVLPSNFFPIFCSNVRIPDQGWGAVSPYRVRCLLARR